MAAPCRWVALLLVAAMWFLSMHARDLIGAQSSDASRGLFRWESREIEAGRLRPDHGRVYSGEDLRFRFVVFISAVMELVGLAHVQKAHRSGPEFLRVYEMLTLPTDPEGRFCRDVLSYKWLHVSQAGTHMPQVRASTNEAADFVRFCRKAWHNLGEEEQRLLGPFRSSGRIPPDIVYRPPYDMEELGRQARANVEPYEDGERLTEEEVMHMINVSIASSAWVARNPTPTVHPWLEQASQKAVQDMLQYYKKLNLRSVPRIPSTWQDVGKVIRAGTIRTFDATPLLPRDYFNMSIKGMADREERGAERIVTLSNGCKPRSLKDFASMNENMMQAGAQMPWNLAQSEAISGDGSALSAAHNFELWRRSGMSMHSGYCHVGYINSRRLKNWYARLPDMVKEMGLEDDIFRDEGYMWMGPIRGGFHYDEEANIYVQLSGESDVFLIPQSHVDVFTRGNRFKNLPTLEEIHRDPVMSQVPFHLLRMMPGDGVIFPGRTFHLFLAQTYDRLAVNFFFIPKWRKMEYTKHDWYSLEANVSLGPERLALRQLWARSFASMYEETGQAVIYMGEKNEYI